jgi:hypothetical protein
MATVAAEVPPELAALFAKEALPFAPKTDAAPPSRPAPQPTQPAPFQPAAFAMATVAAEVPPELAALFAKEALPFAPKTDAAPPSQPAPQPAPPSPPAPFQPAAFATATVAAEVPPELAALFTKQSLPFKSAPAQPAKPPPSTPTGPPAISLTLDQYAALCAALAVFPQEVEKVFLRYGLADLRQRLTVDLGWRERLRNDAALYQEWTALYHRHTAAWTEHARRGGTIG